MNDYSTHLLRTRDLLKLIEEQAALGNLGAAQLHARAAMQAVLDIRRSLAELAERQNRQRAS